MRNFYWLIAERAVRLVLVTGVGVVVARYLGPVGFGTLATALAVVALFVPLGELGLESLARREFLLGTHPIAAVATTLRWLRLWGGVVAAASLALVLWIGLFSREETVLLWVLLPLVFQPALGVSETWFHSRLEARIVAVVQCVVLAVAAIVRLALVVRGDGVRAFAVVALAETMLSAVLLNGIAWRRGLRFGRFNPGLAAALLRSSWPLLLSSFAVLLYTRTDVLMLRVLVGEREVGLYSAAVRFSEIWLFVPGALAASVLPDLLRSRGLGTAAYDTALQRYYGCSVLAAVAVALPTGFAAPWLIPFAYGPSFGAGVPVLVWHASSLVFAFLGVARGQYLVNEGFTRFYFLSTLAGLSVNIGLNLLLIPCWQATGAAVGTFGAQAVAAWISTYCYGPLRANAQMQTRALLFPGFLFRWRS